MKKHRQRGANLVEAALVLSILFLLIFGVIEFGRAYQLYQTITNAAREGARFSVAPCAHGEVACTPGELPTHDEVIEHIQGYLAAGSVREPVIQVDQAVSSTFNGVSTTYTRVNITAPYTFSFVPLRPNLTLSTQVTMRNENSN